MQSKPCLSLSDAKEIVAAGEAYAQEQGLNVAIAVVDQAAHVQHVSRMDGAGLKTSDGAIAKAESAAGCSMPTALFEKLANEGQPSVLMIPGILGVAGGIPVFADGQCCGAVGVSGALSHIDHAVAEAAIAAFNKKV
jgi:uncharacterized protein GlcG (DUF336 family)